MPDTNLKNYTNDELTTILSTLESDAGKYPKTRGMTADYWLLVEDMTRIREELNRRGVKGETSEEILLLEE